MEKKKKKSNLFIWLGLGAAAVVGFMALGSKKSGLQKYTPAELLALLRSKTWSINGQVQKISNTQGLTINQDGTVNIGYGNQYKGVIVDENTIVTKIRNGQPDKELVWKAV